MAYHFSHITDLHQLSATDIPAFLSELPSMLATLRIARQGQIEECPSSAAPLSAAIPCLHWAPDGKDEVNLVHAEFQERVTTISGDMLRRGTATMPDAGTEDIVLSQLRDTADKLGYELVPKALRGTQTI